MIFLLKHLLRLLQSKQLHSSASTPSVLKVHKLGEELRTWLSFKNSSSNSSHFSCFPRERYSQRPRAWLLASIQQSEIAHSPFLLSTPCEDRCCVWIAFNLATLDMTRDRISKRQEDRELHPRGRLPSQESQGLPGAAEPTSSTGSPSVEPGPGRHLISTLCLRSGRDVGLALLSHPSYGTWAWQPLETDSAPPTSSSHSIVYSEMTPSAHSLPFLSASFFLPTRLLLSQKRRNHIKSYHHSIFAISAEDLTVLCLIQQTMGGEC